MDKPRKPFRLTSLLLVEERLTEAVYFAQRMFDAPSSTTLGYDLNAFLAAARSVTFLFQKEFASVDACMEWWKADRSKLGNDEAARFLLELRNFSQKEGRVSIVGAPDAEGKNRYMFGGTIAPVPRSLLYREVADCCLEHLSKLAHSMLRFAEAFPFLSCPTQALTPEGVLALGIDLDTIEVAPGFPPQISAARPEGSVDDRLRLYRRFVDSVDFDEIRRIADYEPMPPLKDDADWGVSLGLAIVEQIEDRKAGIPRALAVRVALASKVLSMMRDDGDK